MVINYSELFSKRAKNARRSTIRELMKYSGDPNFISFGGGYPSFKTFPVDKIKQTINEMSKDEMLEALQYSDSPGVKHFQELIRQMLYDDSNKKFPLEQILVTTGSQLGLALTAFVFIEPDDYVIVEEPTYITAPLAFDLFSPKYVTIPLEHDGMNINILEKKTKRMKEKGIKPKFIYTVPDFQNPGGATMSLEKRKKLLKLSNEYKVPIVEDSPYRKLIFEGTLPPSLMALDPSNLVVSLSTFSKIFCPGLRIGYAVGPEEVIEKFLTIRQALDLHSPTLSQEIIEKTINRHIGLEEYYRRLEENAQLYKEKRDILIHALQENAPYLDILSKPNGGLFLWGQLPLKYIVKEMIPLMIKHKVLFIPGEDFSALGESKNCTRLSFSLVGKDQIEEGTKRLDQVVRDYTKEEKITSSPYTCP